MGGTELVWIMEIGFGLYVGILNYRVVLSALFGTALVHLFGLNLRVKSGLCCSSDFDEVVNMENRTSCLVQLWMQRVN